MTTIQTLLINIWQILQDTAFWLLVGLLTAGIIKTLVSEASMQRWVGGNGLGAIARAALFGAPLPLCSCGVLPAAIGLRRAGASKEATVAFLVSTPETSVDSIAVTYALMGPLMAVYRPLAALCSAVATGLLVALTNPVETLPDGTAASPCCASRPSPTRSCCASEPPSAPGGDAVAVPPGRILQVLRYAGAELLDDIAGWMAVGIVLAGVMFTFIPENALAQWGQGLPAMLMMLVVGIPMYICAVASTPVAAGLLLAGVSPGAVLIFLLVGPATNIASFALLKRELGLKTTLVYLAGIALASLFFGVALEWLLEPGSWRIEVVHAGQARMLPEALSTISALLLGILAIRPLRRRLLPVLG